MRTVKDLKDALSKFPDDTELVYQVAAQDHTAWNMFWPKIGYALGKTSGRVWFCLSHSTLKTMPEIPES